MTQLGLALLLSGGAVVIAGILLGWAADQIASHTGLGQLWTGWIVLAAATSIPEFVTDVSAIKLHAASLAGGDLFGSSLTNMAILALISLAFVDQSHAQKEDSRNGLSAGLAVVLTLLGASFTRYHTNAGWMRLRPESLLIVLIWLAGTRVMYRLERSRGQAASTSIGEKRRTPPLSHSLAVFLIASAMIFFVAPRFAASAQRFAALSGLGDSLVGIWLVGFSTALPDLVSAVTACRLGAFDLAVASLYGSCAFNMVVFFAMDLASPVAVFGQLDPALSISGFLAATLMTLGIAAISFRRRGYGVPDLGGGILLASYGAAIWAVYALR